MRRIRILSLYFAIAPGVFGQSAEPYHIKNDVLGETVAPYRQNHRNQHDCVVRGKLRSELVPSIQSCVTGAEDQEMSYAHRFVISRKVSFDDGKLYLIRMYCSDDTFDLLLASLSEKFGPPASRETNFARWDNGISAIILNAEPKAVSLTFSLDALQRDAEQKQDVVRKKRPSDM